MADFTRTGEYFMAYDANGNEQVISFKHKASDSTFDDGMTLEEKYGSIHCMRIVETEPIPEDIKVGEIVFVLDA